MSDELVCIAAFHHPIYANILKSALEADGIGSVIFDEHMMNLDAFYGMVMGGVKVMVRECDREAALDIVARVNSDLERETEAAGGEEAGDDEIEDAEGYEPIRCPQCGSDRNFPVPRSLGFQFFSGLLLGLPLLFVDNRICEDCRHRWRK